MRRMTTLGIVGCIRSAYHGNPSPFSIDLIQAVGRQHDFNHKATQVVNWQVPFGIGRGIRQYYKFLTMMRRHRGEILVPTLEIGMYIHRSSVITILSSCQVNTP